MNMKTISLAKSKSNPFEDNPRNPQRRLPNEHFIARGYCFYDDALRTWQPERESDTCREWRSGSETETVSKRQRVLEGDSSIDKSVAAALKMYFHSSKIQYEQRRGLFVYCKHRLHLLLSIGCCYCCYCCCCYCWWCARRTAVLIKHHNRPVKQTVAKSR